MVTLQYLYHSMEDFQQNIGAVDREKECLVQIFTTILQPEDSVALARQVKEILPLAQIVGSSVNAIIYRGKQFEQHTMITIEQYQSAKVEAHLFSIADKPAQTVGELLQTAWATQTPKLLRMFLGAYYGQAHQLLDHINHNMSGMEVVGGMSGELYQSTVLPFVFNDQQYIHEGLVCAGLTGNISTYHRINTAHESISAVYTITKAEGRTIYEIEGEPAQAWIKKNLGFKTSQQYNGWEEIANNDPLVRFQLSLEDYKKATRFVRFEESTQQITQYFTELDTGTRFRISYTSPAKCVEECKQTCMEVMETPMEQLFCYNCLFRKLYLENCANWELSPYHKNPISGVFLLGEFGYQDGTNEVLNGSCVLNGICEEQRYLQVDLACLGQLDSIQVENEGLFDFLLTKKTHSKSQEQEQLLTDALTYERSHQPDFYRYLDFNLNMNNMLKYEVDKVKYGFDKLCFIKVENAEILISFMGQGGYLAQLKEMVCNLEQMRVQNQDEVFVYASSIDSFIVAATAAWSKQAFIDLVHRVERYCDTVQEKFTGTPIIMRYVVVSGSEYLLEQAYGQAEFHKNSQARIIIHDAVAQDKAATRKELECINLIQTSIARNQVIPYYQGIYNNVTRKIDKYEALMRLYDAQGKVLTPYYFLETAKKYRLYLDLNLKMMEAVLDDFATIDCAVNINLCAYDIESPRFRQVLRTRLQSFHKPQNITFEILEDEYFSDMDILRNFIDEVRGFGAQIAIDDFGSGYSNLLELAKIQPDYLKIDGQIVREAHKVHENEVIMGVISALGKQLSIDLVAEFVENEEIQGVVEKHNILRSQGYLFSKPQPFAAVYAAQIGRFDVT